MKPRIKIEPPRAAIPTKKHREEDEVKKYLAYIPSEPEPNLGRVYEIKQLLRRGAYEITPEMIEECAHHIGMRLTRGENQF